MNEKNWIMVQVPLNDGVNYLDLAKCIDLHSALSIVDALLSAKDGPVKVQLVLIPAPSSPLPPF